MRRLITSDFMVCLNHDFISRMAALLSLSMSRHHNKSILWRCFSESLGGPHDGKSA